MMRMTYIPIPQSFQLHMPVYARLFVGRPNLLRIVNLCLCMEHDGFIGAIAEGHLQNIWFELRCHRVAKYNNIASLLGAC